MLNHKEYCVSHRIKLSIIVASTLALALLILSLGFVWGGYNQRLAADRAAEKLRLPAPSAEQQTSATILTQASQLASKQKYDEAIALLTPFSAKTSEPKNLRVLAMQLVAQYQQAKGDLATSITWYQQSEALNGAPQLATTLGIASAAAQLYAQQSANPATAASSQQNRQLATSSYQKALTLTTDRTILDQTNKQLAAITKAP